MLACSKDKKKRGVGCDPPPFRNVSHQAWKGLPCAIDARIRAHTHIHIEREDDKKSRKEAGQVKLKYSSGGIIHTKGTRRNLVIWGFPGHQSRHTGTPVGWFLFFFFFNSIVFEMQWNLSVCFCCLFLCVYFCLFLSGKKQMAVGMTWITQCTQKDTNTKKMKGINLDILCRIVYEHFKELEWKRQGRRTCGLIEVGKKQRAKLRSAHLMGHTHTHTELNNF